MTTKAGPSNLKYVKEEEEEIIEGLFIIIEVDSMPNIGQRVETDSRDHLMEVYLSMDKISEDETSREETSEKGVVSEE